MIHDFNQIERILTNFDRQYFAGIFTENLRVACILDHQKRFRRRIWLPK